MQLTRLLFFKATSVPKCLKVCSRATIRVGQRVPLLRGEDGRQLRQGCPEEEAGAASRKVGIIVRVYLVVI